MKVYIGNRVIENQDFKSLTDVDMLKYIADDSECTSIVLDGVLKGLSLSQIAPTIDLVVSKLRSGGELIINDLDFDLIVFRRTSQSILHQPFFLGGGICI